MTRHRRFWVGVVLAALVAACGGDDGGDDPIELDDPQPIVAVEPCDLLDASTAEQLSGAAVKEPEAVVEDDGTTSCEFEFADEADAETAGSSVAALLEIGPGDEDDVPGGSLASTLDMGDAAAVEEEEDKVTVVYVVETVVVFVEVAPGTGEVTPEMVDDVVEFAASTEPAVTEAVTGEPFVPDTTTTTFVDDDPASGDVEIEVDGDAATLEFERAGGNSVGTFEAEAGDVIFVRFPAATYGQPDAGTCLRPSLIGPDDVGIGGGVCIAPDGSSFIDRLELLQSGVYQLEINGDATQFGSADVLITSATDGEGTIEIDGATETATVEDPGSIFVLEFEGQAGDAIFVAFPAATYDDPDAGTCLRPSLIGPDDINIGGGVCIAEDGTSFIDRLELTASGTYRLVIDGDATQTGSADVQLTAAD